MSDEKQNKYVDDDAERHDVIWLSPHCDKCWRDAETTWCQDDVHEPCEECGKTGIKYVLAVSRDAALRETRQTNSELFDAAANWQNEAGRLAKELAEERAECEKLRAMLTEVSDKGLIYWEPNTSRGHVSKALMLKNIDDVLARPQPATPSPLPPLQFTDEQLKYLHDLRAAETIYDPNTVIGGPSPPADAVTDGRQPEATTVARDMQRYTNKTFMEQHLGSPVQPSAEDAAWDLLNSLTLIDHAAYETGVSAEGDAQKIAAALTAAERRGERARLEQALQICEDECVALSTMDAIRALLPPAAPETK